MKKQFEEHFERTWLIIFLFMFVILMIPFPFFYSETYIPAFGGIPLFVWMVCAHSNYICADYKILSHVYETKRISHL